MQESKRKFLFCIRVGHNSYLTTFILLYVCFMNVNYLNMYKTSRSLITSLHTAHIQFQCPCTLMCAAMTFPQTDTFL